MAPVTDVIIVGAGSAGLSAAKELARLGLSYRLIEGSHRIGGRACSEEIAPGVWFDLGCAWLVGGAANPFVAIADRLGITLGKDKSDRFLLENHRFQRNGAPLNEAQRAACLKFYRDSYTQIADNVRQAHDVPVCDVVNTAHEFAPPLLNSIATGWGKDVDEVSTADFDSAEGELGFPVLHGYGNLVAAWGADVPAALSARAEKIDWSDPNIRVETPKGTVHGRVVLVTVSTGVLASGKIRFSPELPDWKREAIHHLPMGTENKMGIHFDKDVFGPDGRGHYSTWNDDGTTAKVDVSVMGLNTAHVFVGARRGICLEREGRQACHEFAVDRVADIFGNDVRKHVTRSIVTAWSTEPWTLGSWACAEPGHAHQRVNLAQTVDRRLFFAGEATVVGAQGTCHGAYESGIRAAREIAETLDMSNR